MALKITIAENEAEFDRMAAWQIIREMLVNPKAVIGLATGRTTKNMHLIVGDIYKANPFDTSSITLFGLDEVTNVPREYAGACYTMLKNEIVEALKIKDKNFIIPPTLSDNFEKECRIFQSELEKRGGIDLQILGLGTNGHLGFNQPGTPFGQETWISKMDEELEARIRKETNTPPEKELGGITLGLKNIMHSRKILLVAKGEAKASIVKEMLYGSVTPDVPASILQLHPNCEFLLDREAAKYIT
ncbi:glucosamine-6-phosphate deaminase [Dysgonomonas sp. PFB1-18]|uniref:6-phosphogluconolactonase n=1 Tax=unclassified Dysgonomonas TaxID=2630389 RepID=UPI002473C429|nr:MULTISPECIES: glucosamine-6-phosphate deaminase [unclassified Dysgonomonas]MDH6310531.1 glucosamine-6-phosphate deaminase [Dysgonomonas sp. PF1-14]MDH6340381.1 glucosamine-6-phosphate deaminase [Dysgonomonas sp. PF1-16]MDH6382039.1 glucosamine-6-phosphate deaminase [Dysgonomonas sp. PFB1-18]MDH6399352.1 glucosamine-6-phosphate deaminase [Dysgonomonas sp. PF1-23]